MGTYSANLIDAVPVIQLLEMPNGGSDARLKKNVKEIKNGLASVTALRPVTWNWKTDEKNEDLAHGFIAQEVEEILPHLVELKEWKDGTERKFLSTNELIPYLVVALKEQQGQIEHLRKQLEDLTEK